MSDVSLKKDSRWDAWQIASHSEFQEKMIPLFHWHPDTHIDIVKRFDLVQKILLFSYFEYELLDVAVDRSLLSLEMALNLRLKELKAFKKWDKFEKRIDSAADLGLFENDDSQIHALRKLRNKSSAHPQHYSLTGIAGHRLVPTIIMVINDLYENRVLRSQRKQITEEANSQLLSKFTRGAILTENETRMIIWNCTLLHFENRFATPQYHIAAYPIFEPRTVGNQLEMADPLLLVCKKIEIDETVTLFDDNDKLIARIEAITDNVNRNRFDNWEREAAKLESALSWRYLAHMQIGELRMTAQRKYIAARKWSSDFGS